MNFDRSFWSRLAVVGVGLGVLTVTPPLWAQAPQQSEVVATPEDVTPLLSLSLQEIFVRSQPFLAASVVVYVPGATDFGPICSPLPIDPDRSPVNENLSVAVVGSVTFLTVIDPRLVLV